MEVNSALEESLWSASREKLFDRETYNQLIDYLLSRLGNYLQTPLEVVGDNCIEDGFFSTTFRGIITPREVFRLSFVGPLGVDFIGEEDTPHYSASLFLFGDHNRLSAGQPDRSYIELIYEKRGNNIGEWKSLGWEIDEFDEYEDIVEDEYYYKKETNL